MFYDNIFDRNYYLYFNIIKFEKFYKMDRKPKITEEILLNAGFKYIESESNISGYKCYEKIAGDLILNIGNGIVNRLGAEWNLIIDTEYGRIGTADISTVWEFNTLMEVFGSDFRL